METEYIIVLISNMLVTIGLFLATLYRIKIEKNQIEVIVKNAKSAEKIKMLKRSLENEKDLFKEMSSEDFLDFLENLIEE